MCVSCRTSNRYTAIILFEAPADLDLPHSRSIPAAATTQLGHSPLPGLAA